MNINWNKKISGNFESVFYIKGNRYISCVNPKGEYYLSIIKSPAFVKISVATKVKILYGTAHSQEEGISIIEKYFDKNTTESSNVKNTLVTDTSEEIKNSEEDKEEKISILEKEIEEENHVLLQINIEDNLVKISYGMDDAKIRYTTNGKDVKATNKIYYEPFTIDDSVKVIKAVAYNADGTHSEQVEKIIEL